MDIVSQIKLSKSEWDSIEVPVSEQEKTILELVVAGYHSVNIKVNNTVSLFTFLKIEFSEKMEDYLYNNYLRAIVLELIKDHKITYIKIEVDPKIQIKSADKIRLERNDASKLKDQDLYEFVILATLKNVFRNRLDKDLFTLHLFTLYKLMRNNVIRVNRHIVAIAHKVLLEHRDDLDLYSVVVNAVRYIEKNPSLLKYADLTSKTNIYNLSISSTQTSVLHCSNGYWKNYFSSGISRTKESHICLRGKTRWSRSRKGRHLGQEKSSLCVWL